MFWDTVQAQLGRHSRDIDFSGNMGLFSGLLRCGDCGRSLCKQVRGGTVSYACGSYRRSGTRVCTPHRVRQAELAQIILDNLNRILALDEDLSALLSDTPPAAPSPAAPQPAAHPSAAQEPLQARLAAAEARLQRLKQCAYEDYREGLLSRADYLRYRQDYERQASALAVQRAAAARPAAVNQRVQTLLRQGRLNELDRATLVNVVEGV